MSLWNKIPARKFSIKEAVKWRNPYYVLTEIWYQRSKWFVTMVILRVSGISSSVVDNNSSFWITSTMPVGMSCGFFLFLVTWTTLLFGGSIVSLCIFTKLLFSLFFTCDVSCWRQKNIAFLCDSSTATRAPPTFIVYSTSYVHCTCFFMIKNELICILGIYVKKVFQSFLVDLQSCLQENFDFFW